MNCYFKRDSTAEEFNEGVGPDDAIVVKRGCAVTKGERTRA